MTEKASAAIGLFGIALVSLGAFGYGWRLGFLTAGALLLLSVKPLWNWLK